MLVRIWRVLEQRLQSRNYLCDFVSCLYFLIILVSTYRFGFADREYSYWPTGLPTAVWANVVDKDIYKPCQNEISHKEKREIHTDSITAPVTGSCGEPA